MTTTELTDRLAALRERIAALAANLPAKLEAAANTVSDETADHLQAVEADVETLEAAIQDG